MQKLLKEYISCFVLNEIHSKTFDWVATLISRIIIADMHKRIRGIISRFHDGRMRPFNYSDELPGEHAELKNWLDNMPRSVKIIKYHVNFVDDRYAHYFVNRGSTVRGQFDEKTRILELEIASLASNVDTQRAYIKDLKDFIPEFKNVIRHELEHTKHHEEVPFELKDLAGKEGMRKYLSIPEEIEAYAVGSVKHAKASGETVAQVVQKFISRFKSALLQRGTSNDEADSIMSEFQSKLENVIRTRYPKIKL